MILYLDTSSLVKLYVEEAFSNLVRKWVDDAEAVATCRVAYPETISAFNRRLRNSDLPEKDYDRFINVFAREWERFVVVDFDELDAGNMVAKYGLRGFDAIHLSAARLIRIEKEEVAISFSSFDKKMNEAARAEGFSIPGEPAA